MFNLYQHMKATNEGKDQKEAETTGHDRFYQERPRSSFRKKKRKGACRRALSAVELNPESIAAANKRISFRVRSVSSEKEDSEDENSDRTPLVAQKIDSLAKILFNKAFIGSGSEKISPSEPPSKDSECSIKGEMAMTICSEYLSKKPRYSLLLPLNAIGSRSNKHWFAIHDNSVKTERLLTLIPLTSTCPIEPGERTQGLIIELLRALHHPYIYPVLDLEICNGHALAVAPFNSKGSLKDLLHKSTWNEEYSKKYNSVGAGLPASQVARFGRQILEGLLFLKDKGFPTFRHLHSGNVIIQNGVARICGLENTLIGAPPKYYVNPISVPLDHVETLSLGHVMFEMCAATDTDFSVLPELQANYSQVVELLVTIFGPRTPSLHDMLMFEIFRKIDLREMKGSCLPNFSQRLSHSCLSLLNEISRQSTLRSESTSMITRGDSSPPRSTRDNSAASCSSKGDSTSPGILRGNCTSSSSLRVQDNPTRQDDNPYFIRCHFTTPVTVRGECNPRNDFETPSTPTLRRKLFLLEQDSTDAWPC